jgi:glutathione synthase/RimK-type ligase-like ATP-grasp enzyme/ribosomal protein S18 acetylase RimI-like enzyme
MNLQFRKAKEEDVAFLLALEKNAFQPFQQSSKQNLKRGIKSSFQEIFIVENKSHGMQPIGAVVLFKYKYAIRIYSIAVLSEYHGKGIGSELFNYVRAFAQNHSFKSIILEVSANNRSLIEWYRSRGFEVVEKLNDYYCAGEDALKMIYHFEGKGEIKENKNIIVIEQPFKWEQVNIQAKIISVKEYINSPLYQNNPNYRVFNLCSSNKYQSYGYYVSLLASARGQRVIPTTTTIRDLRIFNVVQSVVFELNELINSLLVKEIGKAFSLDIYFGHTQVKRYKALAAKLYQVFEVPMFRVNFIKDEKWLIKNIKELKFKSISTEHRELMYQFAADFFSKKRHNYPQLTNYKYDLAILIDPKEENPPSNKEALEKIKAAANKKGLYVEFITKDDRDKINEFDALFIRETTNVNHYTYEFSRLAFAEGLIVIDDPWSILRCSNKIYQYELFKKNRIKTPNSVIITKNLFNKKQLNDFNYPVVIKQPDSAFSLGVSKANDSKEAYDLLIRLFKNTDMVICQEFMYSEFDWRIGILDNKPIFACKYYMSSGHWQIYDWSSDADDKSGNSETLSIGDVPNEVLQTAQKAATLIGDGLYGVDLKHINGNVYVIEVNDNPNIDAGVEDIILKNDLYDLIIDSIIDRIEIAKNIRKINLINNTQRHFPGR